MNNEQQKEISVTALFSMWLAAIARAYRSHQIKHAISCAERDLELTSRDIAESLEVKRHLQIELMNLKRERNSI